MCASRVLLSLKYPAMRFGGSTMGTSPRAPCVDHCRGLSTSLGLLAAADRAAAASSATISAAERVILAMSLRLIRDAHDPKPPGQKRKRTVAVSAVTYVRRSPPCTLFRATTHPTLTSQHSNHLSCLRWLLSILEVYAVVASTWQCTTSTGWAGLSQGSISSTGCCQYCVGSAAVLHTACHSSDLLHFPTGHWSRFVLLRH